MPPEDFDDGDGDYEMVVEIMTPTVPMTSFLIFFARWRTTTRATRGSARATSTAAMDMFALTLRTQVVLMVVVVMWFGGDGGDGEDDSGDGGDGGDGDDDGYVEEEDMSLFLLVTGSCLPVFGKKEGEVSLVNIYS